MGTRPKPCQIAESHRYRYRGGLHGLCDALATDVIRTGSLNFRSSASYDLKIERQTGFDRALPSAVELFRLSALGNLRRSGENNMRKQLGAKTGKRPLCRMYDLSSRKGGVSCKYFERYHVPAQISCLLSPMCPAFQTNICSPRSAELSRAGTPAGAALVSRATASSLACRVW